MEDNQNSILAPAGSEEAITAISTSQVGAKLSMVSEEYEAVTTIPPAAIDNIDGSAHKDDYQFAEDDEEDEENANSMRDEDSTQLISLRQRVPWEKKGFCHRLVHLSHVLSLSNALMFPHCESFKKHFLNISQNISVCSRYGGGSFLFDFNLNLINTF